MCYPGAQVTSTSGGTLDFFCSNSTNVLNTVDGHFQSLALACTGMWRLLAGGKNLSASMQVRQNHGSPLSLLLNREHMNEVLSRILCSSRACYVCRVSSEAVTLVCRNGEHHGCPNAVHLACIKHGPPPSIIIPLASAS
jgi:hypothetical protein